MTQKSTKLKNKNAEQISLTKRSHKMQFVLEGVLGTSKKCPNKKPSGEKCFIVFSEKIKRHFYRLQYFFTAVILFLGKLLISLTEQSILL